MKHTVLVAAVVLAAILAPAGALGQQVRAAIAGVDASGFPNIRVNVAVMDGDTPVLGLGAASFRAAEDERPVEIKSVEPAPDGSQTYVFTYRSAASSSPGKHSVQVAVKVPALGTVSASSAYARSGASGQPAQSAASATQSDWLLFCTLLVGSWVVMFLPAIWESVTRSAHSVAGPGAASAPVGVSVSDIPPPPRPAAQTTASAPQPPPANAGHITFDDFDSEIVVHPEPEPAPAPPPARPAQPPPSGPPQ